MRSLATTSASVDRQSHSFWITGLGIFLSAALPLLLVMSNARLVMSPLFLQLEYTRPGFPEDFYGLTQAERLRYAPFAVNYLLNGEDIRYLGDLHFSDGTALFNARELKHMRDVKTLTQIAYVSTVALGALALTCAYLLRRAGRMRQALFRGGLLTIGLIAAIILAAVLNWDFFFTGFHQLFFESDTWYFAYSDTLIRLFPEQFWFDAALVIGVFTTMEALFVIIITWFWRRKTFDSTLPE
ncbi:MAG: TIGR01906 family membrane protein [Anaerolineae bacterium]|nr:TIGR01906 family membrane protein [Anaerolineae bacterium]